MTETPSFPPPTPPYGAPSAGQPTAPAGPRSSTGCAASGFRARPGPVAGRRVRSHRGTHRTRPADRARHRAFVIAILGGPIFFLYAVGWALMPRQVRPQPGGEGRPRQIFEPAMIAVGALAVLHLRAVDAGHLVAGTGPERYGGCPGWLEVLLRTSWAVGLTAGSIWLTVFIARRVPRGPAPAQPTPRGILVGCHAGPRGNAGCRVYGGRGAGCRIRSGVCTHHSRRGHRSGSRGRLLTVRRAGDRCSGDHLVRHACSSARRISRIRRAFSRRTRGAAPPA